MKTHRLVLLPLCMLMGCDREAPVTKGNMMTLSSLYDFETLPGRVHKLHQRATDSSGSVVHEVNAEFDRQGCIIAFAMDSDLSGRVHLKRQAAQLTGDENGEAVVYELNQQCEIESKFNIAKKQRTRFRYNEQGWLVESIPEYAGVRYRYAYDDAGLQLSVIGSAENRTIEEIHYTWPQKAARPADYTMNIKTPEGESTISMRCEYQKKIPVACDIVRQPGANSAGVTLKATLETTFY